MFYYPINLHYSQTGVAMEKKDRQFYYPINLHYSQTIILFVVCFLLFYYPINLHYSQTMVAIQLKNALVLLPYKFTLLSNKCTTESVPRASFTTL